ncbi:hypothetical protein [Nocardiopsis tropica]|uniref:Uncharacterized protein n=1 Tax=Nocardiopsis tropica TaxID=109330 RepID=A0ABU7L0I4_9ACTN|nr:hypothetical protein [Nocardiopsis umidischolae]MEE2054764.1 hypothetical protein [Nocardiopsis umidischolae]
MRLPVGAHHAPVGLPVCEAHLTYADGTCVLDEGDPVEVWLKKHTCRWSCSCEHHTTETIQPALF